MTALLRPQDVALWQAARPFLDVRNNDEHTLVAYGVAQALLAALPDADADADIVLPAVLLHDVGWKRIPPDLLLSAIGRNPTRPDLVREHEVQGVDIASGILAAQATPHAGAILAIIDGHDTTREARSLNDAVMKDADKVWRTTPHGMRIIRGWYDWSLSDYIDMVTVVSNPRLLTAPGRAMAEGFTASLRAELAVSQYMEKAT